MDALQTVAVGTREYAIPRKTPPTFALQQFDHEEQQKGAHQTKRRFLPTVGAPITWSDRESNGIGQVTVPRTERKWNFPGTR